MLSAAAANLRVALVGLVGLACGVGAVWLNVHAIDPQASLIAAGGRVMVSWAFMVVGLIVWRRQPANRLGVILTVAGLLWLAPALMDANNDAVYTAGRVLANLAAPAFFSLLSFPTGWLENALDRALVVASAVWGTVLTAVTATLAPTPPGPGPVNLVAFVDDPAIGRAADMVLAIVGAALGVGVAVALWRRWRAATRPQRRELSPVIVAASASTAWWSLTAVVSTAQPDTRVTQGMLVVSYVLLANLAVAFLVGLVRARVIAGRMVSGVVARLAMPSSGRDLRRLLAEGLGDPSLELAYPVADGDLLVNADGQAVELPGTTDRTAMPIELDGHVVAVIIYDTAVDRTGRTVESTGAAAALALENARLQAELRAQVAEVTASRARIADAADDTRRRIDLTLRTGVREELQAAVERLMRARPDLTPGSDARDNVDDALARVETAMASLRTLSRTIHPPHLAEGGLPRAVEALAEGCALPSTVHSVPLERFRAPVETAAYVVVAEGLANAARHSHASAVDVALWVEGEELVVEVRDDGIGSADGDRGTGLATLSDRVAVLGGHLAVRSPVGVGTVLRARLPL